MISGPNPDPDLISVPGLGLVSIRDLESRMRRDRAERCLASFREFVFQAWPAVEPQSELCWNWHLDEFCSLLQSAYENKVYHGKSIRCVVNVPPGTSKSMVFSVMFNGWVWAKNPALQFLTASYTPDLSIFQGEKLKTLITSEWYQEHFPNVVLSSRQNAKEKFDTTLGGWRICTSVEGAGTGFHPNFMIHVDDPLKATDSRSDAKMKTANDWIGTTISTRVMHDPIIFLVMQRLNEGDPAGELISKGWEHVCFPMRFETAPVDENDKRNIPDPRDHRTVEGELLWPEMWPEEKVAQLELMLGIESSGQLQQNPFNKAGLLYQREWFEFVDRIDEPVEMARGWDIAETGKNEEQAKRNAWTVGTKIGIGTRTKTVYVMDNVRVQQTLVDDVILSVAQMDGIRCKIREGSGSGKATIAARTKLLLGYDYEASPETITEGDKVRRNNPFRSQAQARNVKLLRGPWNDIWLSVICSFPLGKCKDDVDSTSNAFNALAGEIDQAKKKAVTSWAR